MTVTCPTLEKRLRLKILARVKYHVETSSLCLTPPNSQLGRMRCLSWPRPRALRSTALRQGHSCPVWACLMSPAPAGTLVPPASLCAASERVGSCSSPCQSPSLLLQVGCSPQSSPGSLQQQAVMAGGSSSCWEGGHSAHPWQQHGWLLGKPTCAGQMSPLLLWDGLWSASVEVGWFPYDMGHQTVAFPSAPETLNLGLTTVFSTMVIKQALCC